MSGLGIVILASVIYTAVFLLAANRAERQADKEIRAIEKRLEWGWKQIAECEESSRQYWIEKAERQKYIMGDKS